MELLQGKNVYRVNNGTNEITSNGQTSPPAESLYKSNIPSTNYSVASLPEAGRCPSGAGHVVQGAGEEGGGGGGGSVEGEGGGEEEGECGGEERAVWGNKVEFILTMIGYAVGLGNVWRFPYLCFRNGGGAFLIPYFGTLALVGLPLFYMELAFGQFASLGPIAIWSLNPLLKGLGHSMVIINTIIGVYYNVIISWTIHYFFASMTSQLPWADCGNTWNTKYCFTMKDIANITGEITITVDNITETVNRSMIKTPSEEYFYRNVLSVTDSIETPGRVLWPLALCLLLSWLLVFLVLIKGISSLGKVVYFTSIFPYIVLTIMLVRGLTLPGAVDGVLYYLTPDFTQLQSGRAWSDAATQIFFSLSTCTGGLIAMASYNPFKNNCYRDSVVVPIINCGTSFYGGFAIFSVLGYMAKQKNVGIADVAASGPGLVFVVFPEALSAMPIAPLWSILFFIMMMTLGLSSEFSIVECFFSAVVDEFPSLQRSKVRSTAFRAVGCICFYLIGLSMVTQGGFYLFNLLDFFVGGFPLLIVGFFECVAINYIYGYSNFADDIKLMLGHKPNIYFRFCWCIMSPLILLVITIFMALRYTPPMLFNRPYPLWAEGIGWVVVGASVFLIPAWFFYALHQDEGWRNTGPNLKDKIRAIREAMRPTSKWRPADPRDRTGKYADTRLQGNGVPGIISPTGTIYTAPVRSTEGQDIDQEMSVVIGVVAGTCDGIAGASSELLSSVVGGYKNLAYDTKDGADNIDKSNRNVTSTVVTASHK